MKKKYKRALAAALAAVMIWNTCDFLPGFIGFRPVHIGWGCFLLSVVSPYFRFFCNICLRWGCFPNCTICFR